MGYGLLRTPLWRVELRRAGLRFAWLVLSLLAFLHRATVARNVRVVAVVGSFGKTTTSRAVAAVLGCDGRRRHPAHAITRLRPRDRRAVMEVGIRRRGQMATFARLVRPQIVVVTAVGSEHHRRLGDLEATRMEKAAMVRSLAPDGLAVLNGDDPNVRWMGTQTTAAVKTFGFEPTNDVWASDVAIDGPQGTRFVLHANGEQRLARIRLLGRHMVYPALAAVSVALAEGKTLDDAVSSVATLAPTPKRLEPVRLSNGAVLLYDHYKSPLETVEAALDVLAEIPAQRRIVVLGDVEDPPGRSVEAVYDVYARLGARVASVASRAVFVHAGNDGPRPRYAPAAREHGMPPEAVEETEAVRGAVDALAGDLRPGDVVLVKGANQQRFDRIALALAGRQVGCELTVCTAWVSCSSCPMLARGWEGRDLTGGGRGI